MLDSYMVFETSSLLFFLLPMLVMVAIYGRIGSKIRSRGRHSLGKRVEGVIHSENKQTQSRKAIIRMLSASICRVPHAFSRVFSRCRLTLG